MKVIVTNIQRFSLHDGPGIRTTVFFKGCNLRCPWCSNPENINFRIQEYTYENQKGIYGYEISLEDLEKEILKDKLYYENNGGVTFSGGEALLQFEKLEPLLKKIKNANINICVETALTVPKKFIDIAIKYVDEFIIDVKILDNEYISKINGDINLYLSNIEKIYNKNSSIIFRIPLVEDYTTTDSNIEKIINFLKKYTPKKVEIFKIHRLGENKYKSLDLEMPIFKEISDDKVYKMKKKIEESGIKVEYCKV